MLPHVLPVSRATKNGTSMQRGPDSYSGSLATAGRVQPHHDRPLRASDKPAHAATFSFIMVRRRRCSTPMHEARYRTIRHNPRSLHTVRRVAPISGEHLVVRRETGKEEVVRVHCDEGVANHVGPEPCAGIREGVGEASVGVRAGQPLSREIVLISGADAVTSPSYSSH